MSYYSVLTSGLQTRNISGVVGLLSALFVCLKTVMEGGIYIDIGIDMFSFRIRFEA